MIQPKQKLTAIYIGALIFIIIGFVAGYDWMVVAGFVIEFLAWIYAMLFIENARKKEE